MYVSHNTYEALPSGKNNLRRQTCQKNAMNVYAKILQLSVAYQ